MVSACLSSRVNPHWLNLHQMQHEMVVTVGGRRVFPILEYQLMNLNPLSMYKLTVHFEHVDNMRLRQCNGKWSETISTEKKEGPRKVSHKSGVKDGAKWMAEPVNFEDIRITNRKTLEDKSGSIVHLHTQHRYLPVLTVTEIESGSEQEFRIPHTVFITVTTYRNRNVNQYKININEYSKNNRRQSIEQKENQVPESTSTPPTTPMDIFQLSLQALILSNLSQTAPIYPSVMTPPTPSTSPLSVASILEPAPPTPSYFNPYILAGLGLPLPTLPTLPFCVPTNPSALPFPSVALTPPSLPSPSEEI
ncbi:hypothetical protein L5515_003567 [Caenorhabditis briggsae]|uniref:T-box domain-containing protein n=1 Tax=Caenorhabditis briggsae TaxID=6238 RepID=A0AAE9JC57_CAEBR|nr:hypothetical protein L5515_003567 [Caenorhabditis briggsae]